MLSSRDCPSSKASLSIVASLLQSSEELHAPPSDISVSYGLGSGSQTSSYQPRLSLMPVHQVCGPVVFWAVQREAWPALLERFLKKGGRDCLADPRASVSFYSDVKRFAV